MSKNSIPDWLASEVADYDLALARPPKSVLDIGANIGAWTLRVARQYPEAAIWACEPVADNLEKLQANLETCRLTERVAILPYAARSFDGADSIRLGDKGVTCSFHDLGRQTETLETVRCLSAAYLPECELVKVDTEGCELEILQHLPLTIAQAVVVEYHRAEDAPRLKALLTGKGFQIHAESAKDDTWGILKFTRPGAVSVRKKIFIGVPFGGGAGARFVGCIMRLSQELSFSAAIHLHSGGCGVAMARNSLTADFLASDCTHLLFIDNDLLFTPADVERITSHDEPIVGGMYPLKIDGDLQWCGNTLLPASPPPREDGLQEVRYIGTGFICIARDVFESILARDRDEITYQTDWEPHRTEYDFGAWDTGLQTTSAAATSRRIGISANAGLISAAAYGRTRM